MKTLTIIARILVGLIFLVFGLNGFLHFLPQPEMPDAAKSFFGALAASGYMVPLLFGTQVVGGVLVLAGMVPLGLVLLAPVIVNIIAFHIFLDPAGLPVAIAVAVLALIPAWSHRAAFAPLFGMGGGA